MKLTFEEKKLLYTYGCADLELTRKRLYGVAGLTVDPDQNKQVSAGRSAVFCRVPLPAGLFLQLAGSRLRR